MGVLYKNLFKKVCDIVLLVMLVFTFSDWIDMLWVKPVMQKFLNYDWCWGIMVSVAIPVYYVFMFYDKKAFFRPRFVVEITVNIVFLSDFFIVKHWIWSGWFFLSFAPTLCELYLFIRKTAKAEEKEPRFEIEETNKVTDDYRRDNVVEGLYQFVRNSFYSNQSFATGIAGGWGSGKTTFINKLRTLAQKENIIIVNFDAWRYGSADAIVKNFFNLYRRETGTRIPRLDSSVDDYVCELLDAQGSGWAKMAAKALQRIAKDEDPYETIKSKLNEAQRKVLVFIDDIDRLDASEILGVLRLVRNSANFPYTHFVLTYDKEYVVNTLKNGGLKDPSAYMEKVINMEFPLPAFEKRILCKELEKRIKKYLPLAEYKNEIHYMVWFDYADLIRGNANFMGENDTDIHIPFPQTILTTEVLKTMRDVIRFSNSFEVTIHNFNENKALNEISLSDLYILELLRCHYTDVYECLRESPSSILKVTERGSDIKELIYCFDRQNVKVVVALNSYSGSALEVVSHLLETLFEEDDIDIYDPIRKSICFVRSFNKYFMFRQDSTRISDSEFLLLLNDNDEESQKRQLMLWTGSNGTKGEKEEDELAFYIDKMYSSDDVIKNEKLFHLVKILKEIDSPQEQFLNATKALLIKYVNIPNGNFDMLLDAIKLSDEIIKTDDSLLLSDFCMHFLTKMDVKNLGLSMENGDVPNASMKKIIEVFKNVENKGKWRSTMNLWIGRNQNTFRKDQYNEIMKVLEE